MFVSEQGGTKKEPRGKNLSCILKVRIHRSIIPGTKCLFHTLIQGEYKTTTTWTFIQGRQQTDFIRLFCNYSGVRRKMGAYLVCVWGGGGGCRHGSDQYELFES